MKKITLLLLLVANISFAQNFTQNTGSLAQLQGSITCWIDINGDGAQELYLSGIVTNNTAGGGLYSYENNDFSAFLNTGLPLLDNGSAVAGDFDNDGDLDLLLSGYSQTESLAKSDVYLNNGDNTFSPMNLPIDHCYLGNAQFVDINNDGNLDIAITGMETANYSNVTKIYKNNGNGTISPITLVTPEIMMGKIKFADFDGDGFQDFVLNGWNNTANLPYTKIWRNNGNETFTETTEAIAELWLGDLEWGDFDNDGDQDLVVTGTASADSEVHLYENTSGAFSEVANTNLISMKLGAVEWADFNNDGNLDVFISGWHATTTPSVDAYYSKIFLGDGTGSFSEYTGFYMTPITYGDAAASDYNGDGFVDLIISGSNDLSNPFTAFYKNGVSSAIANNNLHKFNVIMHQNMLTVHSQYNNYKFSVINLAGSVVLESNNIFTRNYSINISNLSSGIYIVRLQKNNIFYNKKIIIQ